MADPARSVAARKALKALDMPLRVALRIGKLVDRLAGDAWHLDPQPDAAWIAARVQRPCRSLCTRAEAVQMSLHASGLCI